ncbi:MAG: bifunctional nicotinamide-nucleotide adenylyltransferase/Nudix hydroxylase [Zoogloeaceae bacterium]|jgi:bifunctional NMN adenylyltransferase/nudix hydrolase|nr:bifunctional nicotinamide-nucleotide adenylyltransferase/Nudix hydroxylase [Zoogloeaceae bacterium]
MPSREPFDAAVLMGRFQPFHNGHAGLLRAALARAGRVLVVLGSAFAARNIRNPFNAEERAAMIHASLDAHAARRVSFVFVRDYYDNRRWAAAVEGRVQEKMQQQGISPRARVALAGFHKDASSDYLRLFPRWFPLALERQGDIDASAIRRMYFTQEANAPWAALLPPSVARFLENWSARADFAAMQEEYQAVAAYRKKWGAGPFVTLDALVTAAGHALLVRRKNAPGRGLWAIPGGFLEGRERLCQGALRELKEETGLDAPDAEIMDALRAAAVFDHPDRSSRGRILTHAHWFDLPLAALPVVRGADDAAEAHWFPVAGLPALETELFEDHFHILDHFLHLLQGTED